jgi:hypothetical protein
MSTKLTNKTGKCHSCEEFVGWADTKWIEKRDPHRILCVKCASTANMQKMGYFGEARFKGFHVYTE